MPRKKEKLTSELILHSGPPKTSCSRAARPDFASQTEPPSALLFVDVTAPKDKASKRKIRAHIMHATHESRRRRGLEDEKKRQAQNINAMIQNFRAGSPLRLASSGNEDPFDSLPVKSFSGMNDLVLLYLENYPGAPPLTDDRLLRSPSAADRALAKRTNTQWHLMITDESSFLIFLAGVACLRNTMSPCRQWQTDYLLLQQDLIRSIRARMPTTTSASRTDSTATTAEQQQQPPPIPYIFAVAALGAAGAVFSDLPAALLHLRGARELVRLRGGIESFGAGNVLARRAVTWCEWLVCAACDLYPTITPPAPPALVDTPVYPRGFVEEVRAVQRRTRGRLGMCGGGGRGREGSSRGMRRLDGVFEALTLVSKAVGERWRQVFQAGGPEKDAVAVVLDWVGNVLLVEVVRLVRGDAEDVVEVGGRVAGEGEDDGEGAGEVKPDGDEGEGWVYAVLLHAANAYLCATLSEIPAISALNLVYLRRLRSALEDAVKGRNMHSAGVQQLGASSSGAEALDAATLMWVLVVGWFLAEKTQAPGKEEFWFWFEARILDLFSVMRIDEDQAAEMVEDFPATDLFRTKWRWLFLQEKFRGLH